MRFEGIDVERWIYEDSKKSDRKRGHEFGLTKDWIRTAIADGCQYCGERDLRMTLDRIDNEQGHTETNVIPCCIRCNYMRRDMPHDAWLAIVPGIKQAVVSGLFGGWSGRVRHTKFAGLGSG